MKLHPGPEKSRVLEIKRAEVVPIRQAFHDNEDWYEDLVEHSHDLLCVHDLEGRFLSMNPSPGTGTGLQRGRNTADSDEGTDCTGIPQPV